MTKNKKKRYALRVDYGIDQAFKIKKKYLSNKATVFNRLHYYINF